MCNQDQGVQPGLGCQFGGIVVPWYRGTVVSWYRGTMVSWYRGIVVSWYRGIVVPWYRGIVVQWYCGTVVPWYRGTVVLKKGLNSRFFGLHSAHFLIKSGPIIAPRYRGTVSQLD